MTPLTGTVDPLAEARKAAGCVRCGAFPVDPERVCPGSNFTLLCACREKVPVEHLQLALATVDRLRDVLQWTNDQCPGKCSAVADEALRHGSE